MSYLNFSGKIEENWDDHDLQPRREKRISDAKLALKLKPTSLLQKPTLFMKEMS